MRPRPNSSTPTLLLIVLRFLTPFFTSARIRFSGIPHSPKPPTMMVAPSLISATASSAFANTLFIDMVIFRTGDCTQQRGSVAKRKEGLGYSRQEDVWRDGDLSHLDAVFIRAGGPYLPSVGKCGITKPSTRRSFFSPKFVGALKHLPQPRPAQVLAQVGQLLLEAQDDLFQVLAVGECAQDYSSRVIESRSSPDKSANPAAGRS